MGLMAEVLDAEQFAFFSQQGGEWDAPIEGEAWPAAPIPSAALPEAPEAAVALYPLDAGDLLPGSNNWAVSGQLTAHGGALVATDMHLPLGVPNIWYRAAWTQPDTGRLVSGVTLPGVPQLVAGSNGQVAWGFTNTQGDWSDVILLDTEAGGQRYRSPDGYQRFTLSSETIHVKGAPDHTVTVRETIWGPVIGSDHLGRELALRWVAHDRIAMGMGGVRMETVGSVAQALALGPVYGSPHQNLVVGDADGNIGWTVAGAIPRRIGLDGILPQSWSDGSRHWVGYLEGAAHPRRENPPGQRHRTLRQ
jgi:penicillin amidase